MRSPGCAFFMPKESFVPEESDRDGDNKQELYTLDDIDFLAAYVIRRNLWYVVPADAFVPRMSVHFNYGPKSQSMFEIYRETWCLMACSARARGRGDIPKRCRCEEMPQRCVVCPKR
jgi:hypothetical protein